MNECNAFARPVPGGFCAFLRTVRDGGAKPLLGRGGRPLVYSTELEATRAAMSHLLRYINGKLLRDGEVAAVEQAADMAFKPELRRKRKRGKHGKSGQPKTSL